MRDHRGNPAVGLSLDSLFSVSGNVRNHQDLKLLLYFLHTEAQNPSFQETGLIKYIQILFSGCCRTMRTCNTWCFAVFTSDQEVNGLFVGCTEKQLNLFPGKLKEGCGNREEPFTFRCLSGFFFHIATYSIFRHFHSFHGESFLDLD